MMAEPGNQSIFTNPDAYADFDGWHTRAAALRETPGPLKIEDQGFAPFWAVIHHADVKEVAQRSAVFKNAPYPILVPGPDARVEALPSATLWEWTTTSIAPTVR